MKNPFRSCWEDANFSSDLTQKCAWRLVRAAEDLMGAGKGDEKRNWCIRRMAEIFPKEKPVDMEDYVRAAFQNFKIEMSTFERGYQ